MLYQLGALSIKVAPFNVNAVSVDNATDYAEKPVLGVRPPLEYVGEGAEQWTMNGQLIPMKIGGLDELDLLHSMRQSRNEQYLMRGDGTPMGWFSILQVTANHSYLDRNGVGQIITVSITLKASQKPAPETFFQTMLGFFL